MLSSFTGVGDSDTSFISGSDWSRYIISDGSLYGFSDISQNTIQRNDNTLFINFQSKNISTSWFSRILSKFPKNLNGKTLILEFNSDATIEDTIYIQNFYNGKVRLSGANTKFSNI